MRIRKAQETAFNSGAEKSEFMSDETKSGILGAAAVTALGVGAVGVGVVGAQVVGHSANWVRKQLVHSRAEHHDTNPGIVEKIAETVSGTLIGQPQARSNYDFHDAYLGT